MNIIWIIVLIVVQESQVVNQAPQGCFRCSDFNRKDSGENCVTNHKDCGDCLTGFRNTTTSYEDACERIILPQLIAQPPSKVYVSEGKRLNLTCTFRPQDLVECVWLRRGYHLEIDNRYKYINAKNGYKTSDCSITITDIKPMSDLGLWQCGSMADSTTDGVMSDEIQLILEEHFIQEPNNTSVQLGSNTTLHCIFDKEVDCVWLRNGFQLEISNRYDYISDKNGKMTKDCSIYIRNVTQWDKGKWTCGSMADAHRDGLMSKEVNLILQQDKDSRKANERSDEAKREKPHHPPSSQHITTVSSESNTNFENLEFSTISDAWLIVLICICVVAVAAVGIGTTGAILWKCKNKKPGLSPDTAEENQEIMRAPE